MNFIDTISKLKNENVNFVVATLVEISGSAPQEVGAKIIVTDDGLYSGTIGGGKIELKIISVAQDLLKQQLKFKFEKYNLQTDIGMTCGGVVSISYELYQSQASTTIAIFGAGHVAQELISVLSRLNFNLICIDPRAEWLEKIDKKINIQIIKTEKMEEIVATLDKNSFIVSLTMGHSFDRPILASALKKEFPFVGVIGSEKKKNTLVKELLDIDKLSKYEVEKLICPIGENFGSNEPAEIAISIAAQLLKKRDDLVKLSKER